MKPRLLDLFCGAGGAGMGYSLAGFDVVGVDLSPQPRYPFAFHQGDAIAYVREHGHEFDAIHASPPCQAHTAMKTMHNAKPHVDLVPETRDALQATGLPYVIENVPGAPMQNGIVLCGSMFDLGTDTGELRRHRVFESNVMLLSPQCRHGQEVVGVYGGHVRNRKRVMGIYGKGVRIPGFHRGKSDWNVDDGRKAMGIDWMTLAELCQAIPPAYTEYIGRQLLNHLALLPAA